jgi:hypothetical protein
MNPTAVFAIQVLWFTLAWATLARLVVWPFSQRLERHRSVALWLAPQMFRVMGLGLLVPNLAPGIDAGFARSTATGDSLTAALALLAFVTLMRGSSRGFALAWAATAIGLLDGIVAVSSAARLGVAEHLAGQWYVPAMGVPLMGVAHIGCIAALLRARRG